jgi:hypothetical protein
MDNVQKHNNCIAELVEAEFRGWARNVYIHCYGVNKIRITYRR